MARSGQIQHTITANLSISSFSNLTSDPYFITFFQLDSITFYCKGWRLGENTQYGLKFEIEIKKDDEDVFWFSVANYDNNDALESSTLYK